MRKWSAGSAQASFQLMGGDSAWHHARPGMIVEMLANGKSATPVLILDEVDKIGSDGRYPVTPVLLDLLEPGTGSTFQDMGWSLGDTLVVTRKGIEIRLRKARKSRSQEKPRR